ncbi:MAG: site-specific integrase [Verrucomicrobia bacterium]|nr:site-specific integrase [Verrucomicrobiota bacterium]
MKQSSKDYRLKDCLRKIEKTWPELWERNLDKIKESECRAWGARLHEGISSQYFNNVVGTLRLVIGAGIRDHISRGGDRFENPANAIAKSKIPKTELRLPEPGQFRAIVEHIRNNPSGKGDDAAALVEFLAYSGMRLYTEAHWMTWEDIDWNRKELIVRGSPETHTKNWEQRRIPMLSDMEDLLARIRSGSTKQPTGRIMRIKECPGCLRSACKAVGIPAISHHDLRHLFATRCIESGVDIPTVSRWLGHKDGGALAMRTYGHLRNEHSRQMAEKVKF